MITITAIVSGITVLGAIASGIRNYRRPAGEPDMAQVWHEGGPL